MRGETADGFACVVSVKRTKREINIYIPPRVLLMPVSHGQKKKRRHGYVHAFKGQAAAGQTTASSPIHTHMQQQPDQGANPPAARALASTMFAMLGPPVCLTMPTLALLVVLVVHTCTVAVAGLDNGLSKTPTMGWNSWNAYKACPANALCSCSSCPCVPLFWHVRSLSASQKPWRH